MKRKEHYCDRLSGLRLVMGTDDDQPIVAEICTGFTSGGRLAITIDCYDYEDRCADSSAIILVHPDDSRTMARRNGVAHSSIPDFIADCLSEWREIVNANFREARDCFKEITECLLDEGCRFRIERTPGRCIV